MKIKGSIKNLKIDTAFVAFAVGTVVALGLRIYQAFSGVIDFETGFFNTEHITTPILYAVLAVTAVAIFAVSFLAGEIPQEKMPLKKSPAMTLFSGLFSIALSYCAVTNFSSFNELLSKSVSDPICAEQGLMAYLMKSGAFAVLGQSVFAALSVVYFLILLFYYSDIKQIDLTKFKFLSLCPLFWATFRMIQRFTRTISFMNVSSLLLELFMIAFMMMFFMYMAQMSSNVNALAISFKVFSYGLIASMFAAVVSVPRILLMFFNSSYKELAESGSLACPLEISDIAFCAFTVCFLILCLTVPRIKNLSLKETEKLIEEKSEE